VTNKNNNSLIVTELQCIGCIAYWTNLVKYKYLNFEQHENFRKTGFRNRYHILSASGPLILSIPIEGGRASRVTIREVTIDNSDYWQKNHWRGLESCYNKSPFFFFYQPYLLKFYSKHYKWLWDFNFELFEWLSISLKLNMQTSFTDAFRKDYTIQGCVDARNYFKPSNRLSFPNKPYLQVFGTAFEQNLSLFDLLFNLGPESGNYLLNQCNY
jgi:hypothetical protein